MITSSRTGRLDGDRRSDEQGTLPIWKKALFGLVTVCLVFVVLEAGLALCGIRPLVYHEDPFVGFQSRIPLFVEQTLPDGAVVMKTASNKLTFFNAQSFRKRKPPDTYRIFCLGGSTTFGRPYDDVTSFCGWLRELLPAADGSKDWDVINAGGISYASYRVALLMEELVAYEPDLFILYTGHNEFLEERTYSDLKVLPPAYAAAATWLFRSRTSAALKRILDAVVTLPDANRPDRILLSGEVDTILEHTVGPSSYTRNDLLRDRIVEHFRLNLHRMVNMARSAGAEILFVTPASNIKDCSPFKSEHRAGLSTVEISRWEALFLKAQQIEDDTALTEALTLLEQAEEIDARHAGLWFQKGRTLDEIGRHQEAKQAFELARDEDICPVRALSSITASVREVGASRSVRLVDFDALIQQRSVNGIPDAEHFVDHVHPTIEANRLLALLLIDAMTEDGIVRPETSWNEDAIAAVVKTVEARLDTEAHARAQLNLSKVLTWAGKYEEARRPALAASKILANDPLCYYLLAVTAEKTGHQAEAIEHYRKVLRLQPDEARAHYNLACLLAGRGQLENAISHFQEVTRLTPDDAEAHKSLGMALAELGKLPDAVKYLRQALRINPDDAEAHHNLGIVLDRQNKPDEAAEHLRAVLRIAPEMAEAHNDLGAILAEQGRLTEAAIHFAEAVRIEPDLPGARQNLMRIKAMLRGDQPSSRAN